MWWPAPNPVASSSVPRSRPLGLVQAAPQTRQVAPPVSQVSYTLEYGEDQLEASADAFTQRRVLLVDDVLATGGTLRAAAALVEQQQGVVVGASILLEIPILEGRQLLAPMRIESVLS